MTDAAPGMPRVRGRGPDAPPCDSLAEALVLDHLRLHPDLIGQHDLGPLLVFPEHRWLWAAMVRAWMRAQSMDRAFVEFIIAFRQELRSAHPHEWEALLHLLDTVDQDEGERRGRQALAEHRSPNELGRGFSWWLARLQRISDARRGIVAAQEIAAGFWRWPDGLYDIRQAYATLERHVGRGRAESGIRVDV